MRDQTLLAVLVLFAASCAGFAQDGGALGGSRSGPLANLPSPPGPHIEKIKQLGDNQWLELGQPAADPKWGRARGRAWGGQAFAFAPDIRGAYFTGEGVHAFVKPDGYGMDDFWVYDINANQWICLHPGTNVNTLNAQVKSGALKANEHGVFVNREGQVVVGHVMIHAWGFLTYDTDRCKFVAYHCNPGFFSYYMPGGEKVAEALAELKKQKENTKQPPLTPLAYDTATGKFELGPAANASPGRALGGYPQFIYVPAIRKFLAAGKGRTDLYDPETKSWSRVKTNGSGIAGNDTGACYDPKRKRVYAGNLDMARGPDQKASLKIYDVAASAWSEASMAPGKLPENWSHRNASIQYDAANDVVIVFQFEDHKTYIYDPQADAWRDPIELPVKFFGERRRQGHAFYDPELNVHFLLTGGDSADNAVMQVYRYGNPKGK